MASQSVANNVQIEGSSSLTFDRLAGLSAIGAGVFGLLYSVAFVIVQDQLLYSLCLLLGGLATTIVMVALYRHLAAVEPGVAQLGLLLGFVAALGSVVHAGYDLSNAINPPAITNADLPSQIDPRGLLTFGIAGLGLFAFSWLMSRTDRFPRSLAYIGYLLAVLLVVIYLGRLVILDAKSLSILLPAAVAGFVVNPLWNIWLGLSLVRGNPQE